MSNNVAGAALLSRVEEFLRGPLAEVEDVFRAELRSRHACVRDLLAHAAGFRGKRLRPMLLLLSAAACGGIRREHKVLAAVVEMIHTATLVHDDVLDEALARRHVATVNARWNNETSVLFGDYLFTHAFHLAASLESTRACRLIGHATNIVCEGELTQIAERGNLDLTEERYLQIIDGKTAELCAVSCQLGALYAGADEAAVEALTEFGRALGMAFQIADDMLDLVGDESRVGKTLGSDLRKQKLTLPLIRLLATAREPELSRLRAMLSHPDETTAARLLPYIEAGDALAHVRRRSNDFATAARLRIAVLPDSPARQLLEALTDFVMHRSF
jgi:octaprenyl-diphosphate synthase